MAGKRGASSELNHDNWDREEEPEDSGSFAMASEDVIKRRVIKVAKRRNPISSTTSNEAAKPLFTGFSGFSKGPPAQSTASTFSFLSNLTTPATSKSSEAPKTNGLPAASDEQKDEYLSKLKGLNESVSEWIKQHVATNPLINLQPVFKDYDRYFAELEKTKSAAPESKSDTNKPVQFQFGAPSTETVKTSNSSPIITSSTSDTNVSSSTSSFSFGVPSSTSAKSTAPSSFSFGNKTGSFGGLSTASTVTVSFGDSALSSTKSNFSFGSSGTSASNFSFTNSVKPPTVPVTDNKEEESEEPPKNEFTPVVEEGNIYNVRCKVFVKKDGSFSDRGVGQMYLKPVPDKDKVQLIVRADTNLGNLICNFILSDGIPMQRMGKKDVMLVCLPTPDTKPPPVPILLRVKSTEEADELLEILQKNKK